MKYPRLLLVHMTRVYTDDPYNLLVRNLFSGWPKDSLAQIYTGDYDGEGNFCGRYYQIGVSDRRFGHTFSFLKPIGVRITSGRNVQEQGTEPRIIIFRRVIEKFVHYIIKTGIWDLVFNARLSSKLNEFICNFKPEIMYTQGYSLSFTKLALKISHQFNIPIFYFPVDDWHSYLYQGHFVHREVEKIANQVAQRATLRFALGHRMAETYTRRYKTDFECVYNADDFSRFTPSLNEKTTEYSKIIIGMTGSLYLGRIKCVFDLLQACLLKKNKNFEIKVYCSNIPTDTPKRLLDSEYVRFLPLPTHGRLPQILSDCHILFLPESFDPIYRKAIELSISTKCHLYMMSGRPIIVYGPEWSGTVDYAKKFDWGFVVDKPQIDCLNNAIGQVLSPLKTYEIIMKGLSVAKMNHDLGILRKRVLNRVQATATKVIS